MRWNWVWIAVGAACVAVAIAVAAGLWRTVGGAGISLAGWIALVLGVLLSLAVGIGLMALVFYSSRHGYDEIDRDDRG